MSTRVYIGYKNNNNKYIVSYCHHGGEPKFFINQLKNIGTFENIKTLIDAGDMSGIKNGERYSTNGNDIDEPSQTFNSLDDLKKELFTTGFQDIEYLYIFDGKKWKWYKKPDDKSDSMKESCEFESFASFYQRNKSI